MLAMELIPAIRARLSNSTASEGTSLVSGRRAALWRAQQYAAGFNHTLDDLRRYCLESLKPRRFLDEQDENDYLRGYREGFQAVLTDIRQLETPRAASPNPHNVRVGPHAVGSLQDSSTCTVGVAQLVELLVVVQAVGGSSPLAHPLRKAPICGAFLEWEG